MKRLHGELHPRTTLEESQLPIEPGHQACVPVPNDLLPWNAELFHGPCDDAGRRLKLLQRWRSHIEVSHKANADALAVHVGFFAMSAILRKRPADQHLIVIPNEFHPEVIPNVLPAIRLDMIGADRPPGDRPDGLAADS